MANVAPLEPTRMALYILADLGSSAAEVSGTGSVCVSVALGACV